MAKLFVIHAQAAPIAIILRRGPSSWFHLIEWDTAHDTFTHGAWIKGRLYEDRCDLSPDGRLFAYFVLQGTRSETSLTHAWTAVSRTPWLHALVLWPQGDTWGGGVRFVDNRTLALRDVNYPPHKDFPLRGLRTIGGNTPLHTKTDDVPDADWCGHDYCGNVIFSRGGQLFRRRKQDDLLLADFTDLRPDPQPPPDWATEPL